jgi:hypothetical protein
VLAGVLDDDRVAREQGGDDDVHRDEERVVPRGDVEHDAEGLVADIAGEIGLFGDVFVLEGILGDVDHVAGAGEHAVDLAPGEGDGFAHLAGDVGGDLKRSQRALRWAMVVSRQSWKAARAFLTMASSSLAGVSGRVSSRASVKGLMTRSSVALMVGVVPWGWWSQDPDTGGRAASGTRTSRHPACAVVARGDMP